MIDLFLSTGRSVVRATAAVVVVGASVWVGVVVAAVAMRRESQSAYITTNVFDIYRVNARVGVVVAVRSIAIVTAAVVVALERGVRLL